MRRELEESKVKARSLEKDFGELKSTWKHESEDRQAKFSEIVRDQQKAEQERENKEKNFAANVVKVIKEKDKVVREAVDKNRSLVMFGVVEKEIKAPAERKERDMREVVKILGNLDETGRDWQKEIDELHRLGPYAKNKNRPIKIKLRLKATADEILTNTWQLSKSEELNKYTIRKDLSYEERELIKTKLQEAKRKNEERSEEKK